MTTFADIHPGERARVLGYRRSEGDYERRLMGLGLTPGVEFTVLRTAPLGDPVEIAVRGYRLSLRRREAACLTVARL